MSDRRDQRHRPATGIALAEHGAHVLVAGRDKTRTEGTAPTGDDLDDLAAQAPTGRPATPGEIAAAVVYLTSDAVSFVHGVVLPVDGGRTAV